MIGEGGCCRGRAGQEGSRAWLAGAHLHRAGAVRSDVRGRGTGGAHVTRVALPLSRAPVHVTLSLCLPRTSEA